MTDIVLLKLQGQAEHQAQWQAIAKLFMANTIGHQLQDLFDEISPDSGDAFEEILDAFPDIWAEQAEYKQGELSVEFLSGPDTEELAEALEGFFKPFPLTSLSINQSCDDAEYE
ncbi:hypothetical protein AHAT_17230 [Agarivorans sp. Toyoura001]|uniref:hypothetical protein n=1 Tax=Agarivorans sp. Toyoura001 TaxID=2283141 RepID=UPI0010DA4301|nr:hypothetical protein [Agarivorans sp. Toyoura001]GDY25833.1 hypothetical protein AHAT_17230 [Agarivorans sp. Toyoura001]